LFSIFYFHIFQDSSASQDCGAGNLPSSYIVRNPPS
jgi:hypothetical protein